MDGSIHMKSLTGKVNDVDRVWAPRVAGKKVETTTTKVMYSGNFSSDERTISNGIRKTTDVEVSSKKKY